MNYLLKELKKLGYDIPQGKEVLKTQWIDEKIIAQVGAAAGKLFNWTEEDFIELGKTVVTLSFLSKLYIKYFASITKTLKNLEKSYNKYIDEGQLKVNVDKDKRRAVCRIEGLDIHPTACIHFKGVIAKIMEISTGGKDINIEETKCSFTDKVNYHQYEISW